jgi:DNA-binding NtrC family response regulator
MPRSRAKKISENGRILVIDDEAVIRKALKRYLEAEGYEVVTASDGREGLARYQEGGIDLALVDLMMPKLSGRDVVQKICQQDPDALAIIMTAYGTIPSAVDAIRAGAYHYVTKPFELDDIGSLLRKALEFRQLKRENLQLRQKLEQRKRFDQFVGQSAQVRNVFDIVSKVAETDSTVLILGESGTGKELVACAIHEQSERRDGPMVTVNCAAMPEGLLESEFFGHVKGSFTGATMNREGRFAQADGGTIFLDEIADMSPKLQVKVLRVIQERRFQPVGSNLVNEVDVRIIAATNRNLAKMVQEGSFREDLYYRLNVIPIEVPPLRERESDIPMLIRHFLEKFGAENGVKTPTLDPEVQKRLLAYSWPGNVRELENMMERLVVLCQNGRIGVDDLPSSLTNAEGAGLVRRLEIPDEGLSFKDVVGTFEKDLLLSALNKTNWNKNRAASLLKLNRTTLIEKIKKQGLERHE